MFFSIFLHQIVKNKEKSVFFLEISVFLKIPYKNPYAQSVHLKNPYSWQY
ncbi:hypothetical protein PGB90_001982 [Kerria lacca]